MTNGIFIASYAKDFPFLKACLISIAECNDGFDHVTVCVPEDDFERAGQLFKQCHLPAYFNLARQPGDANDDGFMRAQLAMLSADTFMDDDNIWLVGSDCLVWDTFSPSAGMRDGKPIMWAQSVKSLRGAASATLAWLPGTTRATGIVPSYDYMRMLPLCYPRLLFRVTRGEIEDWTGASIEKYVLSKPANFSEQNVLGAVAYELMPRVYSWEHDDFRNPHPMIQFWSHGGLDHKLNRTFEYLCSDGVRRTTYQRSARDVIADVLGDAYEN